jgi:hypothetical protein
MACPKGKILRKGSKVAGYTRSDGTVVKSYYRKAICVKDTGKPGKTKAKDKVLPVPKKGNLSQYGYKNVKNLSTIKRHQALKKAINEEGPTPIIKRLNLIANYNKNTNPKFYKILRDDIMWIKNL